MESYNGGVLTTSASPSSAPFSISNLSRTDYVLIMLGFTMALVVLYHLVFMKCCPQSGSTPALLEEGVVRNGTGSFPNWHMIPSKVYTKEADVRECGNSECAVCLCGFVDGEDHIRQLPLCKHFFHSSCIDMWLHSHSDCPICRAAVSVSAQACPEQIDGGDRGRQDIPA